MLWVKSTGKVSYDEEGIPVSLTGKFVFTNGEPPTKDNKSRSGFSG